MLKLAAIDTAEDRILVQESEEAIREAEKEGWIPLDEVRSRLGKCSKRDKKKGVDLILDNAEI